MKIEHIERIPLFMYKIGVCDHRPTNLPQLQQQENNIFIKLYLGLARLVFGLVTNPNFQQA
jgi:hypothetical protein